MPTQALGWNTVSLALAPNPGAFVFVAGTSATQQGADTGTLETGGTRIDQSHQRCIRYRGHQTFVAVQGDTIYRSTDAGASWSTVFGPDADLGTTIVKTGLFVVTWHGVTQLVILGRSGAGSYSVFNSIDGVTWTKFGPFTGFTDQSMALQANVLWRGALYFAAGTTNPRSYRLELGTWILTQATLPSLAGSTFNDACFCVFNDRLFGLWTKLSSDPALFEYDPSQNAWIERTAFGTGANGAGAVDRKSTLFVHASNMYAVFTRAFISGGQQYEWKAWQIDSALSTSDVSSVLSPLALAASNTTLCASYADGPAGGVGPPPILYVMFGASSDPAAPPQWNVFQWNGGAVNMTAVGSAAGHVVPCAYPWGVQFGGNVYWTSGERVIEHVSSRAVHGRGERWKYRLYSPNASPDNRDVRAFYGIATQEYPSSELAANDNAVLANPSHGTLIGQVVQGVDAGDNGATDFEVTWLPQNQTLPPGLGSYAKRVLHVT